MTTDLQEELTDAVFRTALEPDAWGDVLRLMKLRFPSSAKTFYFLHLQPRQVRPVCVTGIEPRWLESFNVFCFAPDNPWIRLTQRLHRPGVVRTNERLERLLCDPTALFDRRRHPGGATADPEIRREGSSRPARSSSNRNLETLSAVNSDGAADGRELCNRSMRVVR
jgi:hypothetical protein